MGFTRKSDHNQEKIKEQNSYTFLEEKVMSKRKKMLKKVAITCMSAALFGCISCLFFCICYPVLSDRFGNGTKKIYLPAASPEVTATPFSLDGLVEKNQKKKTNTRKAEDIKNDYSIIRNVASEVNKSIVKITIINENLDILQKKYEDQNITSGSIMGNNGKQILILTTKSSVEGAKKIRVTFDNGTTVDGKVFNRSDDLDLAVISVDTDNLDERYVNNLKNVSLGETYTLPTGTPVLALGAPNGYMYSMDEGIISTSSYSDYITDYKVDLFSTNINSNTSGDGIVVNLDGQLIGIITHYFQNDLNRNYMTCLSISKIKPIIQKLLNKEKFVYFGIVGNDITEEIADKVGVKKGIYVSEVDIDSPAFNAGIRIGDVIQRVNDNTVSGVMDLYNNISGKDDHDVVNVSVIPAGSKKAKNYNVVLQTKQ